MGSLRLGHISLIKKLNKVSFSFTLGDNLAFINITSYGMLSQHERPMGIVVHTCNILDRYVEILG